MRDDLPDFSKLPEESARNLHRFSVGSLVLLVLLLLLAIIYSIGQAINGFHWQTFRNGLLTFGVIMLAVSVVIILVTVLMRNAVILGPESLQRMKERRALKAARKEAAAAIDEKHRLSEERARLTAQLKATFLYERETSDAANAQASEAFRQALQTSVMQSCRIAFDQINQVIEQYEAVVREIESSALPAGEKAELLRSLTAHLDIQATENRHRDAQRVMESEIWKVRFRKARLMAKERSETAVSYLQQVRSEARSAKMRQKIDALVESLRDSRSHVETSDTTAAGRD